MKDVMIDLETLGTGPDACIIQIGAVYFDRTTGELGREFKRNIDPRTCIELGGKMDADPVLWWLGQSEAARQSIMAKGGDFTFVMQELSEFLTGSARVWSHATFDFVIIMNAYKRLKMPSPVSYKAGMDLRTLVYLAGITFDTFPREGTHHDGLDDAKYQVKYTVAALNAIKGNKAVVKAIQKLVD